MVFSSSGMRVGEQIFENVQPDWYVDIQPEWYADIQPDRNSKIN